MSYLRRFPKEYLDVLLNLEEAKKKKYVPKQDKDELFGIKALGYYFHEIELNEPLTQLYQDRSTKPKSPPTLKDFIQETHKGKIDHAISEVNNLVKDLMFFIDVTNKHEQLEYLKLVGDLLLDAEMIIKKHPTKSKGARIPSPYVAGYCLMCHNTSSVSTYYCSKHTRSTGDESEIKTARRVIEKAFSNLDLRSSYDADKDISKREPGIFKEKCYKLEGWAKQLPEHIKFNDELESITKEYVNIDEDTCWPDRTAEMLNEIIKLTNRHKHTQGIFSLYFSSKDPISEILNKLQKEVFHSNEEGETLSPSTAITIISRMSQFRLIKLASHKKILI